MRGFLGQRPPHERHVTSSPHQGRSLAAAVSGIPKAETGHKPGMVISPRKKEMASQLPSGAPERWTGPQGIPLWD